MSRPVTQTDNEMMESFMGKIKNGKLKHHEYRNLKELEKAFEEYKDYYNKKRLKLLLGYKIIKNLRKKWQIYNLSKIGTIIWCSSRFTL